MKKFPKIRVIKDKPDAGGYGQGRSPSVQRKIDMWILNLKSAVGALVIGFSVGYLLMGMAKIGEPCNETGVHRTHVRCLMSPEEWQLERAELIALGNDSTYLQP